MEVFLMPKQPQKLDIEYDNPDKQETIAAFLVANSYWGVPPFLRYGLADSTIALELAENYKMLYKGFSWTLYDGSWNVMTSGKAKEESLFPNIDGERLMAPDIINLASISKPILTYIILRMAEELGSNAERLEVTAQKYQELYQEMIIVRKRGELWVDKLANLEESADGSVLIPIEMLIELNNAESSNRANEILKAWVLDFEDGSEAEQLYQRLLLEIGFTSLERNTGSLWDTLGANTGSFVEAKKAFVYIIQENRYPGLVTSMTANQVNFGFDATNDPMFLAVVERKFQKKVKRDENGMPIIIEKTGRYPGVRWGKKLTEPENGTQPIHSIFNNLVLIEFEDGTKLAFSQYLLIAHPMLKDDQTEKMTQLPDGTYHVAHTTPDRIRKLNAAVLGWCAPEYRALTRYNLETLQLE